MTFWYSSKTCWSDSESEVMWCNMRIKSDVNWSESQWNDRDNIIIVIVVNNWNQKYIML